MHLLLRMLSSPFLIIFWEMMLVQSRLTLNLQNPSATVSLVVELQVYAIMPH